MAECETIVFPQVLTTVKMKNDVQVQFENIRHCDAFAQKYKNMFWMKFLNATFFC